MASVQVNTHFHPFRMRLGDRKPVQLYVQLQNKSPESKKLTFQLACDRNLAFDKSGIAGSITKRVEDLPPGKAVEWYFDVYPKQQTQAGVAPVHLKVTEHFGDFKYVQGDIMKKLELKVEA